jgi:hypothetical protein
MLNKNWVNASGGTDTSEYPFGYEAIVIGHSRFCGIVRVKFVGRSTPVAFHQSFFDKVRLPSLFKPFKKGKKNL